MSTIVLIVYSNYIRKHKLMKRLVYAITILISKAIVKYKTAD